MLDNMEQGISMIDADFNVIAFNRRFLELYDVPPDAFRRGDNFRDLFRYRARRGDYGPGDVEALVQKRFAAFLDNVRLRTMEQIVGSNRDLGDHPPAARRRRVCLVIHGHN